MFESWGRVVYRAAAAGPGPRRDRGGGRGGLGHRGVRRAAVGAAASPPRAARASRRATWRRRAFGRDAGDVVVLYSSPRADRARRRLPRRRSPGPWPRCPPARCGRPRPTGPPARRSSPAPGGHATYAVLELAGGTDSARINDYDAIKGQLAAPGLRTQVGGQIPTEAAINNAGHLRHRPGRGHLHAGAADPAAGHLRQPGRGQPAAGHRRHRHPRLVHRAAAADPGHRRSRSTRSTSPRSSASAWPSTTACSW